MKRLAVHQGDGEQIGSDHIAVGLEKCEKGTGVILHVFCWWGFLMITKIADLLNELRIAEAKRIDAEQITHTTTIGDMYEGLTASILQQAIPPQADLRVVSGFAVTDSGKMSGQNDCMIVSGSGKQLPYVEASVWNIRNVIAVIEVKKTLFSGQVETAHKQLRNIFDLSWEEFQQTFKGKLDLGPAMQAYRLITGHEPPPYSERAKLPLHLEMLYRTLVVEMITPVRIIFGYGGFASEESLREGFFDFLERHHKESGYAGSTLPTLIVCGHNSLVKQDGFPFTSHMKGDRLLIYGSSHENPLYFLLELIWTRLSHRFTMPDWYMSDLTINQLLPVLSGRAKEVNGLVGWEYWMHSPEIPSENPASLTWEPVCVSDFGHGLFYELCKQESLPQLPEYVGRTEEEKAEFQKMIEARIIGYDGERIVLLTMQAEALIAPDGKAYIGENAHGRLSAWLHKTFPTLRAEIRLLNND